MCYHRQYLCLSAGVSAQHREDILGMFRFVGQLIAQALQDERPLDLPVCRPFCKWLLRQALRVRCGACAGGCAQRARVSGRGVQCRADSSLPLPSCVRMQRRRMHR